MKKKHVASVSHDACVIEELRDDPRLAVEYLKYAFSEADDEEGQYVLLKAIKQIAEAQGIAKVAKAAGIPRESLYRALSAKGNPRLTTLLAVVHAMGLQMTVQPIKHKV